MAIFLLPHRMLRLPALPPEIHGCISDFLQSRRDLFNYLQASRNAFGEVERRLYLSVHLITYNSRVFDGLIGGLLNHSHRPLLIREFRLSFGYGQVPPETILHFLSTLAAMSNLIRLQLQIRHLKAADLNSIRATFKLQRLEWSSDDPPADGTDADPQPLLDFFTSQPSITHLSMPFCTLKDPLPSNVLPNLKIVHGPALLMRATLPVRG